VREQALGERPIADHRVVDATINYLEKGVYDSVWYSSESWRSKMPLEPQLMKIEDMTDRRDECTLDREGFALIHAPTKVTDFRDPAQIRDIYLKELELAVMAATGAKKVIVQGGGVVRLNERSPEFGLKGTTYPGRYAHCDYSDESGPAIARNALKPEEAEAWMRGRFMIINTWRALSPPPLDAPLAVCDARTCGPNDHVISQVVLGPPGGPGMRMQTNMVVHNPTHRWCYFRGMTRDDLLLFRGYDSDAAHHSRTPHTAFDDPSAEEGVPRESIDIRAIAYFGT